MTSFQITALVIAIFVLIALWTNRYSIIKLIEDIKKFKKKVKERKDGQKN